MEAQVILRRRTSTASTTADPRKTKQREVLADAEFQEALVKGYA